MASIQATSVHAPLALPAVPPILAANDPSYTVARCRSPRDIPAPLLSPIRLLDRRAPPTCSAPCGSKRRRQHVRGPIRQRHCKLADCPIVRSGSPALDQLPWISMVNQAPAVDLIQPWNIADLSQLPFERSDRPAKTTGPIRSRKSSLRSAPFPTDISSGSTSSSPELSLLSLSDDSLLDQLPFARARRLSFGDERPSTPPPRASALSVDVDFRNLMPVVLSDDDRSELRWRTGSLSP